MPSFTQHSVSSRTKSLIVGDSGSGKTSLLATLANAGKKVRILDFDDGLDILASFLTPEGAKNVSFVTLKDSPNKKSNGIEVARKIIFADGWNFEEEKLGKLQEWGPDVVLAIDSLTFMGDAAKHWAMSINNKNLYSQTTQAEWGDAARITESIIDYLTGDSIKCNLVVLTHPRIIQDDLGVVKVYPSCVGAALPTKIARYFNNVFLLETKRDGTRKLRTVSNHKMELKCSAPKIIQEEEEADLNAILNKIQSAALKLQTGTVAKKE